MTITFQEVVESKLMDGIRTAMELEKEYIVQQALKDFETAMRQLLAKVALTVTDFYSVQRLGSELVIHVKIDKASK